MFGYYVKTYGINIAVKVLKGLDSRNPNYGVYIDKNTFFHIDSTKKHSIMVIRCWKNLILKPGMFFIKKRELGRNSIFYRIIIF